MFLSAIAKPVPEFDFDGLLGIWRVSAPYVAKRKSKYHNKGDTYENDCSMNTKLFHSMMLKKVIPAIKSKMSWAPNVFIQADNASPHTGDNTITKINTSANAKASGTKVKVVLQPPQSPDTNANDLGFFHSLQTQLRRNGRQERLADREQLVEKVEELFQNYPASTLKKLFETKSQVVKKIHERCGTNEFSLPHGGK